MFLKDIIVTSYKMFSYCNECYQTFEIISQMRIYECCNKIFNLKKLKQEKKNFYYLPLREQLMQLVNTGIYCEFRKEYEESDIVNGKINKYLKKKKVINENDITIQWNTDGVSLFESSNVSIWPILVSINELDYRKRRNNILLCGLWFRNND